MKEHKFLVTFITGKAEIVYASGAQPTSILAQAIQIKKGNNYEVSRVIQIRRY